MRRVERMLNVPFEAGSGNRLDHRVEKIQTLASQGYWHL